MVGADAANEHRGDHPEIWSVARVTDNDVFRGGAALVVYDEVRGLPTAYIVTGALASRREHRVDLCSRRGHRAENLEKPMRRQRYRSAKLGDVGRVRDVEDRGNAIVQRPVVTRCRTQIYI